MASKHQGNQIRGISADTAFKILMGDSKRDFEDVDMHDH